LQLHGAPSRGDRLRRCTRQRSTTSDCLTALSLSSKAYYHGGLDANSLAAVTDGAVMEMVDLQDMSTYLLALQPNSSQPSDTYRALMAPWRGSLMQVGGQFDNPNGESVAIKAVTRLDMGSRTWQVTKTFADAGGGSPCCRWWGRDAWAGTTR